MKEDDVIQVDEPEKPREDNAKKESENAEEIEPATPEASDKKEDEIEELKPTEDNNAEDMGQKKARIPPPMLGKVCDMFL